MNAYTQSNNEIYVIMLKANEMKKLFMPTIYNSQPFINIYIHNCIYTIGCRLSLHTVLSKWRSYC